MIKIMTTRALLAEMLHNVLSKIGGQEITIIDHDTVPLSDKYETPVVVFSEKAKTLSEISEIFRTSGITAYVMSPSIDMLVMLVKTIELVSTTGCNMIVGTPADPEPPLILGPIDEPIPFVSRLSPRENLIMKSLMIGDSNKIIARKLNITEATIKVHVKAVLRKLRLKNRTQAAMWGMQNRITPASLPPPHINGEMPPITLESPIIIVEEGEENE